MLCYFAWNFKFFSSILSMIVQSPFNNVPGLKAFRSAALFKRNSSTGVFHHCCKSPPGGCVWKLLTGESWKKVVGSFYFLHQYSGMYGLKSTPNKKRQLPEIFYKKGGVPKNHAKFTGKQTLIKRHQHRCFPVKFAQFLRTSFYVTARLYWWTFLKEFVKKEVTFIVRD